MLLLIVSKLCIYWFQSPALQGYVYIMFGRNDTKSRTMERMDHMCIGVTKLIFMFSMSLFGLGMQKLQTRGNTNLSVLLGSTVLAGCGRVMLGSGLNIEGV